MKLTNPSAAPIRLAAALGGFAGLAVLATLGDPGLTTDEPLDIRPGRRYVDTLLKKGTGFFDRATIDAVFRDNAEHPPLGRWLLGLASKLGQPFEIMILGPDPLDVYWLSARLAPAACFAILVGLITHTTARRHGSASGVGAGVALLLMPRVFAHAHFGALDTFITLFWVAALLSADRALTSPRPVIAMAGAGAVWGLALLTKIHAWFLVPVILIWTIVRLGAKGRSALAFALWLVVGLAVFLAGWPWLWPDLVGRLATYLGTGVGRTSIQVLYFGQVYADRDVPWHYPWFYFAATVPIGLHTLGIAGVIRSLRERSDRFPALVIGSMGLFLVLFSTRIPVYDGERLFLMVFPLWAVLIGRGFGWFWERTGQGRAGKFALAGLLLLQGFGVVMYHPFGLSYYNALVGGIAGAERLGLELTFWGDAVDRQLLDHLVQAGPDTETVALVPTLYPGQGIMSTTRAMARRKLILADQESIATADLLVVSRRTAYWPKGLREKLSTARVLYQRTCRGVWLSRIYFVGETP
jgi:4-amino-4-deoxy-L-arabinose transferase-like glycosyltransferase